jgi:hypothetical protein
MSKSPLDAGIPVLTEVIDDKLTAPQPTFHATPKPPPKAPPTVAPTMTAFKTTTVRAPELPVSDIVDVPAIDGWLNDEWGRLERKIGGRILSQVMERLEADIENRVRDALADVLQMALATLTHDIRDNLQTSLQKVITEAVKEEIFHMQNPKK